jgi:N-formylglutamate amidohydrolase
VPDRRADIILGNRYGTSCQHQFFDEVFTKLESHGYHVGQNSPYAGGYITAHYGNPEKNVHALQIEINRALYMDQKSLQPTEGFVSLKKAIAGFVQDMSSGYSSLLTA